MDDKDFVKWVPEALALVRSSPYAGRIWPLCANPNLGEEEIDKLPNSEPIKSNCHGTVLFCIGREDFVMGGLQYNKDLHYFISAGRPGFVKFSLMEKFLEGVCEEVEEEKAVLAGFWDDKIASPSLSHTAVYLGKARGMGVLFHQPDKGRKFCLTPFDEYWMAATNQRSTRFYALKK
ncbi:hypothetical protein FJZ19_04125 [Candidatus Pacearchaeota archaeon]|nr:hypothetical protein [Candidatus Pacearchaeota archaeon]